MKNLLLIFLLANILYFMWSAYVDEEPQAGIVIVDESDLGPSLDVVSVTESVTGDEVEVGSDEPLHIEAVAGLSCVSLGPLRVIADVDSAVLEYSGAGMKVAKRSLEAEVFIGHWVQIRNVTDQQSASDMLAILDEGGLDEAYYVETELFISLGLFGDIAGAEKVESQAKSMDLPAEILPRTSNQLVHYVDIELPPGRGAGAIIEQYGEDLVALRDAATCPL